MYCEEHEKYKAQVFLNFIKVVLDKYPTGKIVIILDNARIRTTNLIHPFLDANKDRIELLFLSPYSPELNLIEDVCGGLKSNIIINKFFTSINEVRLCIDKFVDAINQVTANTLARVCYKI